MTALSSALSNAFVIVAFAFCLRLAVRSWWRSFRGGGRGDEHKYGR